MSELPAPAFHPELAEYLCTLRDCYVALCCDDDRMALLDASIALRTHYPGIPFAPARILGHDPIDLAFPFSLMKPLWVHRFEDVLIDLDSDDNGWLEGS